MATEVNRHGLKRYIPADVKREVRQRWGFGCVICGSPFIHYDHFDPPFEDALRHDPNGIVLLCAGHHDRKTRGLLSDETVRAAALDPCALRTGFSFGPLDIGVDPLIIVLGQITCSEVDSLITVDGESIFSIRAPEKPGQPYLVSASLANEKGEVILEIVDNESRIMTDNWDAKWIGQRLQINSGAGLISLVLRTEPPKRLVVERLSMLHRGMRLEIIEGKPTKVWLENGVTIEFSGGELSGRKAAIEVSTSSLAIGSGRRQGGRGLFVEQLRIDIVPPIAKAPNFSSEFREQMFEYLKRFALSLDARSVVSAETQDKWYLRWKAAHKELYEYMNANIGLTIQVESDFPMHFADDFNAMLDSFVRDMELQREAAEQGLPESDRLISASAMRKLVTTL